MMTSHRATNVRPEFAPFNARHPRGYWTTHSLIGLWSDRGNLELKHAPSVCKQLVPEMLKVRGELGIKVVDCISKSIPCWLPF